MASSTSPEAWTATLRRLLTSPPTGWQLFAICDRLYAAGPLAQAVIAGRSPVEVGHHALASCADWIDCGRITDSGAW